MATTFTFADLVEKLLTDEDFNKRVQRDPQAALRSVGIAVSDELIASLRAFDWDSTRRVCRAFGEHRCIT